MKYSVIGLTIAAGASVDVQAEELEEGNVVKVALFTDDVPSDSVNIQIKGSEGEVHPFVNYKEFTPTNGDHFESRKDFNIEAGRKITVTANADDALVAEFKCQVLFYIQEKI